MNPPTPSSRTDACGVVGCTSTEARHTHTGDLIRGERVILQPRTLGAPAVCFSNARGVLLDAREDGAGRYLVKLDDDGTELRVHHRDVTRAKTWKPPAPRRELRQGGHRREAIDPALGTELELPLSGPTHE